MDMLLTGTRAIVVAALADSALYLADVVARSQDAQRAASDHSPASTDAAPGPRANGRTTRSGLTDGLDHLVDR